MRKGRAFKRLYSKCPEMNPFWLLCASFKISDGPDVIPQRNGKSVECTNGTFSWFNIPHEERTLLPGTSINGKISNVKVYFQTWKNLHCNNSIGYSYHLEIKIYNLMSRQQWLGPMHCNVIAKSCNDCQTSDRWASKLSFRCELFLIIREPAKYY